LNLLTYSSLDVQEINYEEIEIENKIGQGGFSMIYKGEWNSLPVAVKIIFDPNVTEELLNEFNNEIKMLFMLRHPNIILLIGISSKPQKLAIITEYVENGSLFDLLHRSK
jgi:serine/threonine protein kinase